MTRNSNVTSRAGRAACLAFLSLSLSAMPATAQSTACGAQISQADRDGAITDMRVASEAVPFHGLGEKQPQLWMRRGRVNMGNNPGRYTRLLGWSAIFATKHNTVQNPTVELRNMRVLVLSKRTGMWHVVEDSSKFFGRLYIVETYNDETVGNLQIANRAGSADMLVDSRYMSHFWPFVGRRPIEPDDIAGIYTSVEARIAQQDYDAGARFVMDMAADYWADDDAVWDNYVSNGDVGVGRMKMLQPQWRTFYMTTVSAPYLELCIARQ